MGAPLSTSRMRREFAAARCNTGLMTPVRFHGWRTGLLVEARTADAWRAFSEVMKVHDYRFRESAGGTYNCRKIAGTDVWSLHAYGLALDLNPSKNPYGTRTTDMPAAFRADVKAITTVSGRRVFAWGGDWTTPDTMHWQVGATPDELATGLQEDDMPLSNDDIEKVAVRTVKLLLSQKVGGYDPAVDRNKPSNQRDSAPRDLDDVLHRLHVLGFKASDRDAEIIRAVKAIQAGDGATADKIIDELSKRLVD